MNTLVVYYSKYGNTQKVAEIIASECTSLGSARAINLDDLTLTDLKQADIVIMGSPTHRMNLPEAAREKLNSFPKRVIKRIPVAAFDTSYKMHGFLNRFTAAKKLVPKLRKMGGVRVVPPETFHVTEAKGPLHDGEIERAQTWAGQILAQIQQRKS